MYLAITVLITSICFINCSFASDTIILFAQKKNTEQGWSIYRISPNGYDKEVVIPFRSGQGEYNPDISSDGQTILFNTYRYGGWKLATFDMNKKVVNKLDQGSAYYVNGVFSPDGKYIAYEKSIRGSTHICVANSDGSNETQLTGDVGRENRAPSWTPDGRNILFFAKHKHKHKHKQNQDIYSVNVATKAVNNITRNESGNDFNPSVSPDGKTVAFYSDRNGYLDVFTMPISGDKQVSLTDRLHSSNNPYNYFRDNNTFWLFKISWSPDGKSLVFSNIKDDNLDLFTASLVNGNIRQITQSPESELTPVWGKIK